MLTQYIRAGMRQASYELLDDGTFFGTIQGFQGLWANEDTLESCRSELRSTFEDWILFSLHIGAVLPILDELDLNMAKEARAGV